ncbi:hypothetical protein [Protofrankia sp. BMG5.30]|uniref:hypothetical protein n=2 Tax=Protofrankia TaxID=2994361 RepID=UPI00158CCBC0|nr:hypothetical protein [Protofrankia sp. BMG5.30]
MSAPRASATGSPGGPSERSGPPPAATGRTDTASPGTQAAPGTQASPGASDPAAPGDVPDTLLDPDSSYWPPAVFVGQPCVPARDIAPRQAINGLILYCQQTDPGQPRWGLASPPPPDPAAPVPNAECTVTDTGQVVQGANGRPVICLRDPDGNLRWGDVS